MTRHSLLLACCVIGLFSPARAFAYGIEWLDKLSGPGDFFGARLVEQRILCWIEDGAATRPLWVTERAPSGSFGRLGGTPACWRDGRLLTDRMVDAMRAYVTVAAALLKSVKNEPFGERSQDPEVQVKLFALRPGMMFRPIRWMDVGASVGFNWLSGAPLDGSVQWVSIHPRVLVTPFDRAGNQLARSFKISLEAVIIGEQISAEFQRRVVDRNLRVDSFNSREIRPMIAVIFDPGRRF